MSDASSSSFNRFARTPAFKAFLIGALVLLLVIPLTFVWLLVSDREQRAKSVKDEIASAWGGRQHVKGPYLIVSYTAEKLIGDERKRGGVIEERRAVFLPEKLVVDGQADTEILHRSIYDASVYRASVTLEGRFATADLARFEGKDVLIRWRRAHVAVDLASLSVLKDTPVLVIGGDRKIEFEPGTTGLRAPVLDLPLPDDKSQGVAAEAPNPLPDGLNFKVTLTFNGSSGLDLSPLGRETSITLASNWPHPSFWGTFLPTDRTVKPDGFSASWRIPYVARNLPLSWSDPLAAQRDMDTYGAPFGVQFYVPIDFYDLVNRATKYALMFVVVAFAAIFVLEVISGQRVHAAQYLFVGIAMVFFYVLLLSLSEHAGFGWAYVLASLATGGMLSLYIWKITDNRRVGLIMLAVFLVLYGLLYMILRSEDYALLAGAIVGFVMLAVAMFATLRVRWGGDAPPATQEAASTPRLAA